MKNRIALILRQLIRVVSSFWLVVLLLAVGWGPVFLAESVREARPDLDAAYVPQHFALQWMSTTVHCSLLAIVAAVVWAIRYLFRIFKKVDKHP
jgi:hypothetical protein